MRLAHRLRGAARRGSYATAGEVYRQYLELAGELKLAALDYHEFTHSSVEVMELEHQLKKEVKTTTHRLDTMIEAVGGSALKDNIFSEAVADEDVDAENAVIRDRMIPHQIETLADIEDRATKGCAFEAADL